MPLCMNTGKHADVLPLKSDLPDCLMSLLRYVCNSAQFSNLPFQNLPLESLGKNFAILLFDVKA